MKKIKKNHIVFFIFLRVLRGKNAFGQSIVCGLNNLFSTTRFTTIAFWAILLSISVLLSGGNSASGLEFGVPGNGIRQGNLMLHPYLRLKGQYDDNIFYTNKNTVYDWIGIITPGAILELPWDDNLLQFDFRAMLYYFRHNPRENHQDYRLKGLFTYNFSNFKLKIEDLFLKTSSRENTDYSYRIERIENTGSIALLYSANSFELQGKYKNFYMDYFDDVYSKYDHQEHFGILTAFYRIAPKTKALVEYTYDRILYRDARDRDGFYNEVRVGFKGEITSKLYGIVKVGYQNRQYQGNPTWEDYDGIVGLVSLEQRFSKYSNLRVGWERTTRESTYEFNSYYLINRFWVVYSQQLAHKLRGYAKINYYNYRYPYRSLTYDKKRVDEIWQPEVGVVYRIQDWLSADLSYRYKDRNSNFPGHDYADNRISLELSAMY